MAAETKSSVATARSLAAGHFAIAMDHYRARRFRESIREFELALTLLPSAEVHWNLARAHEQLGENALAVDQLRQYLRDRVDAPDAADVNVRIDRLLAHQRVFDPRDPRPTVGLLAIESDEQGQLVLLDGKKLESDGADRVLSVPTGRHRLEVSKAGHVPFLADIEITPGAMSAAHVELLPLAHSHASAPSRTGMWVMTTVSAALVVTSGSFGLMALHARGQADLNTARRWAVASDLALGGALCSAVAAALMYFSSDYAAREARSQIESRDSSL